MIFMAGMCGALQITHMHVWGLRDTIEVPNLAALWPQNEPTMVIREKSTGLINAKVPQGDTTKNQIFSNYRFLTC